MKFTLAKKATATFQREIIEKAGNKAKFYASFAFLTVVLFVMLGIRPVTITAAENRKVLLELRDIKTQLETKLDKLEQGTEEMNGLSEKIDILYIKIPQDLYLEEYLEEVVFAAAKSGFVVQRFRQQESTPGAVPIEIEFTGSISSLPKLTEALENTRRFTSLKTIRTEAQDNYTDIRLVVTIYTL